MKLFDNGCYMWDSLVLGMAKALICEARTRLDEEDNHKYDNILADIDETCIDTMVVDLLVSTARAYCRASLLHSDTDAEMEEEGFDLFYDLYMCTEHHLLQDREEVNKFYNEFQRIFERTPSIGESIDGDIRVFFE